MELSSDFPRTQEYLVVLGLGLFGQHLAQNASAHLQEIFLHDSNNDQRLLLVGQ